MRILILLLYLMTQPIHAQVNLERHGFSLEYGFSYHTVKAEQKENNSSGQLTTDQNPYWLGSYTFRIGSQHGIKLYGGLSLVRFNDPRGGELVTEYIPLSTLGMEFITKTGPLSKIGFFLEEQEIPLYRGIAPNQFEIFKPKFSQAGINLEIGQRRRIGLLWGFGLKGFALFPTRGGDVITEFGGGAEAYARLGWVGPLGTLHQVRGFLKSSAQPNSEVNFIYQIIGYAYQVSISY